MANTLPSVVPRLLAQGLLALRENIVMPRICNRAYERMAGQKGTTIDVPIPSAIAARPVTPGPVSPGTGDISPTHVPIPLDQWIEAPFTLNDKEMLEVMEGVVPMQASEAIKSLANTVDDYLLALGKGFYGFHGIPGTTPFGSGDTADVTASRAILHKQLAPMEPRYAVLDPDAEAAALELRAFQDASWSSSAAAIIDGNLNRKLGFQWFMEQRVPTHTAGTLTGTITASATAAGATSVQLVTDAAEAIALLEGDIITFSNHAQTYVVGADLTVGASSNGTVSITPGLQTALAGTETVTVKASHVTNLLFHRDAIAFATRPLQNSIEGMGFARSAVDPESGLALRLEVSREHRQTQFAFDILYGGAVLRPQLGMRLAG